MSGGLVETEHPLGHTRSHEPLLLYQIIGLGLSASPAFDCALFIVRSNSVHTSLSTSLSTLACTVCHSVHL